MNRDTANTLIGFFMLFTVVAQLFEELSNKSFKKGFLITQLSERGNLGWKLQF